MRPNAHLSPTDLTQHICLFVRIPQLAKLSPVYSKFLKKSLILGKKIVILRALRLSSSYSSTSILTNYFSIPALKFDQGKCDSSLQ